MLLLLALGVARAEPNLEVELGADRLRHSRDFWATNRSLQQGHAGLILRWPWSAEDRHAVTLLRVGVGERHRYDDFGVGLPWSSARNFRRGGSLRFAAVGALGIDHPWIGLRAGALLTVFDEGERLSVVPTLHWRMGSASRVHVFANVLELPTDLEGEFGRVGLSVPVKVRQVPTGAVLGTTLAGLYLSPWVDLGPFRAQPELVWYPFEGRDYRLSLTLSWRQG